MLLPDFTCSKYHIISIHCDKTTLRWMRFLHVGITDMYCIYNQPREGSMDTQIYILGIFNFQVVIHWDKNAHMQMKTNKTCLNFLNNKTCFSCHQERTIHRSAFIYSEKQKQKSRRNDIRGYHFWSFFKFLFWWKYTFKHKGTFIIGTRETTIISSLTLEVFLEHFAQFFNVIIKVLLCWLKCKSL